jgi:hypothetical protein
LMAGGPTLVLVGGVLPALVIFAFGGASGTVDPSSIRGALLT